MNLTEIGLLVSGYLDWLDSRLRMFGKVQEIPGFSPPILGSMLERKNISIKIVKLIA